MKTEITGRVIKLGDNIDTDIIIPTQYMTLPSIKEMCQFAFSPLRPDLVKIVRPGDIMVAGKNFGCGSSREQAPEILKELGFVAVVAKSFARIFYRNAMNNGLLVVQSPQLCDTATEGKMISIDLRKNRIPENLLAMLEAGGLVNYYKQLNARGKSGLDAGGNT
ncbi:MAG: 3-isopropylmalate dehydratase [Spirochaetaceae bacterium]|nr:MAG: 3-isopropylmalate dehydratase [Spirochaetaceae bacterium]